MIKLHIANAFKYGRVADLGISVIESEVGVGEGSPSFIPGVHHTKGDKVTRRLPVKHDSQNTWLCVSNCMCTHCLHVRT